MKMFEHSYTYIHAYILNTLTIAAIIICCLLLFSFLGFVRISLISMSVRYFFFSRRELKSKAKNKKEKKKEQPPYALPPFPPSHLVGFTTFPGAWMYHMRVCTNHIMHGSALALLCTIIYFGIAFACIS